MPMRFAPRRMRGVNPVKGLQFCDHGPQICSFDWTRSFSRAWIELGWVYSATGDKNSALDAFQKAVEADPKQILPYKILALDYAFLGNRDNAISTWQRLQSIAPDDPDIAPNLGGALYGPEALLGGSVAL